MNRPTLLARPVLALLLLAGASIASCAEPDGFRPADSTANAKGSIAIWSDQFPFAHVPADPDHLASLLRSGGYRVRCLTTDQLIDPSILRNEDFDLLILPYGGLVPAVKAATLRRFLQRGGRLVTLGGRCFYRPIYPTANGWTDKLAGSSDAGDAQPIVELSEQTVARLAAQMKSGDQPAEASAERDDQGQPAVRVVVPELQAYKYLRLGTKNPSGHSVLCFRARGDADTRHLCVEVNEADGSRWKAVVALSPKWRAYELSTGQFVSYATEGRGDPGDYLHAERAKRIAFGFPASLVGTGRRSFEISQIAWRPSAVQPQNLAEQSLRFDVSTDLIRAFRNDLKHPQRGGDITAFFRSEPFKDIPQLRAAPNQTVLPADWTISGSMSGWTATILEDNDYSLESRGKGRSRHFLPTERLARSIPLLWTPNHQPAAALFVHTAGPYAGNIWACFGVADRDLFSGRDPQGDKALLNLVDRMLGSVWLTAIQPRFTVQGDRAKMQVFVSVLNPGKDPARIELHARLTTGANAPAVLETVQTKTIPAGQTRDVLVQEAWSDQFDWKRFTVQCRLVQGDQQTDCIECSVDVRGVLRAICERLVDQQQRRGDGKFSGIGYVDNRGTRALLAAYDLFGDRRYLDAAIAWGQAIIAEQREDGGYLMGYGYYAEGNESYVADGGEIACGIGRLVKYVPEQQRQAFVDSLAAYMAYRDSFRCEGGGIGVGWCKTDYSVRPVKRLDPTPPSIFMGISDQHDREQHHL